MNLAKVQGALARILTDAGLRERWQSSPQEVAEQLQLGPLEAQYLERLSAAQVEQFARGLLGKRLQAVKNLLPSCCERVEGRLVSLFEQFAAGFTPSGPWKHRCDALAFAAWIRSREPSLADLTRLESARLETHRQGFRFLWRRFSQPVPEYSVKSGDVVLWWRWGVQVRATTLWPPGRILEVFVPEPASVEASDSTRD